MASLVQFEVDTDWVVVVFYSFVGQVVYATASFVGY